MHPVSTPPTTGLPAYLLYGEQGAAAVTERLHVETISSRSRLHDWEIKPHRHEAFFQILYMARGRGEAWLDAAQRALLGPCIVCVPAMAAHGFVFAPGVEGHVITVQAQHLAALLAPEPSLGARLAEPVHLAMARHEAAPKALGEAVQALADEHAHHLAWRAAALDAALWRLVLALARALPSARADTGGLPVAGRAVDHLTRYRTLVDARFREQPSVVSLAADLGITATQLNRICRAVLGRSALDLLHARIALEAQRHLAYTTLSVKHIALDLGFSDPGYFTRFFQRVSGATPSAWRQQAHR